ncbi:MAG: nickel-responsive regulator [Candidatus Margulisbacteria bacterium GWF2_35_9]|nr:MAG: nickel-responsive regulator [Candidatus Margulisbacteria bacterium GWF2_35_9]
MPDKLTRFGVSIPENLISKYDQLISNKGYKSRSEAFRDIIRNELAEQHQGDDKNISFGTLTIIYDHHHSNVSEMLMNVQHDFFSSIISNTHLHVDHHNCLEVLILKDTNRKIREIADRIISIKGVKYGKLVSAVTGSEFS